ncbi:U20-hexatoxin-Hi1a-like [Clavelina lepadiformis]|uniref:U20-hexatoxin-Hi1a-like n=1 Tax=Clavelina lepadiformis TaxID=159417 RepID=UPI00404173C0
MRKLMTLLMCLLIYYITNIDIAMSGGRRSTCAQRCKAIRKHKKKNPNDLAVPELPQCDKKGQYLPKQCYSTGACWCSKPNGDVIPDTTTYNNESLLCCLEDKLNKLEIEAQYPDIQDGVDFPECAKNGSWIPLQCHDMGYSCWCVDSRGNRSDQFMPGDRECT